MSSSSRNRETQKEKLRFALGNADSAEEMVKIFNKMEKSTNTRFSEDELDLYCSPIANKLHSEGKDFEKVVTFGKRGLKYMLSEMGKTSTTKMACFGNQKIDMDNVTLVFREDGSVGSSSSITPKFYHLGLDVMLPNALNMLGSVCCELGRFNESLSYYNWAVRNLTKLLEKDCPDGCFLKKLEEAERGLFKVKRVMGRAEEAVPHVKKVLECKEKRLEEGCVELGEANKDVYQACFAAVEFKEALPYCLKALEIHRKHFGGESVEVAGMVRNLGSIYSDLGDHEKAREQNELAKSILKKVAPDSSELLAAEMTDGYTLMELGKHAEAINVFKAVVSNTNARGFERAQALGAMANASLSLRKFADTKKYIKTAQHIYEKEDMNPLYAAVGFEDFSKMYEKMNDLETSISFVKKALKVPKLPEKLLLQASSRLFSLYALVGKEKEGIPYMEDAVEKLKESFGLDHLQVGYGYGKLGQAYMNSVQEKLAVNVLEKAKEIMDASLGRDHIDSLLTSHHLAVTYSRLGRMELATDLEEKVVSGCKGLGPSGQDLLDVAVRQLKKFKEFNAIPEFAFFSSLVAEFGGLKFGFGL